MSQRETGTVKWFNDRKGFGFISREQGDDLFVHYSSLEGDGFRTLKENDRVEFTVTSTDKGLQAENVILVGPAEVAPEEMAEPEQATKLAPEAPPAPSEEAMPEVEAEEKASPEEEEAPEAEPEAPPAPPEEEVAPEGTADPDTT